MESAPTQSNADAINGTPTALLSGRPSGSECSPQLTHHNR